MFSTLTMTWHISFFRQTSFQKYQRGFLREYMALAVNGQQIRFGELVETMLDIERYEQHKQKKVRMGRGWNITSEERHHLHYGYTNIKILYGVLYDTNSPARNENSRKGKCLGWSVVSHGQCSLNSAMSLKIAIRYNNVFTD
jgi:hypothetical protein